MFRKKRQSFPFGKYSGRDDKYQDPVGEFIIKKGGSGSQIYFCCKKDFQGEGYICWKYYQFSDRSVISEEILRGFHCGSDEYVIVTNKIAIQDQIIAIQTFIDKELICLIKLAWGTLDSILEYNKYALASHEHASIEHYMYYMNLYIFYQKRLVVLRNKMKKDSLKGDKK
jgi:hypothetical protein